MDNAGLMLMNSMLVGFFTLAGLIIPHHLSNKRTLKDIKRQKALQAYQLINDAQCSLMPEKAYCKKLIFEKNMITLHQSKHNISRDILNELELIIIENFNEIHVVFKKLKLLIVDEALYLNEIISRNSIKIFDESDQAIFNDRSEKYLNNIIAVGNEMQKILNERHINPQNPMRNYFKSVFGKMICKCIKPFKQASS